MPIGSLTDQKDSHIDERLLDASRAVLSSYLDNYSAQGTAEIIKRCADKGLRVTKAEAFEALYECAAEIFIPQTPSTPGWGRLETTEQSRVREGRAPRDASNALGLDFSRGIA